jgi:hypothetical protein
MRPIEVSPLTSKCVSGCKNGHHGYGCPRDGDLISTLPHETPKSQLVAGLYHLGFAALYIIAALWHARGAVEHFKHKG